MTRGPSVNARVKPGVWYVGPGTNGGHFYAKVIDGQNAITLCTDSGDGQSWTAEDLEAIASHKRTIDRTENPGVGGSIPPLPI